MTKGEFTDIDKELALKVARAHYLGGTLKEYHQIGDFKPLLLLNKENKELLVGLLHSDKTMTMVKFKEAGSDKSKFV